MGLKSFALEGGLAEKEDRPALHHVDAMIDECLDRLVERCQLSGLTYYYRGLAGNRYERLGAGLILGNSLLTARGIAAAGEGDLKTSSP